MPTRDNESPARCANCKTQLLGDFCHRCGQENKNYLRNIFALIGEFFGEFGHWDGRLWRTLYPLWVRPGYLSRRFVEGHRAPYVPPLRMYLFTSILAFFVFAQLVPDQSFELTPPPNLNSSANDVSAVQPTTALSGNETEGTGEPAEQEWIPFLSLDQERSLEKKLEAAAKDPRAAISNFFSLAPQVMLLLLPLFALILKLLYIFRRHFYLEHLILALHTHTLVLQLLLVHIGLLKLAGATISWPLLPTLLAWIASLLIWWLPIYLLLSQKAFYRQGWPMTLVKFGFTGALYIVMFTVAVSGTAIRSIMSS